MNKVSLWLIVAGVFSTILVQFSYPRTHSSFQRTLLLDQNHLTSPFQPYETRLRERRRRTRPSNSLQNVLNATDFRLQSNEDEATVNWKVMSDEDAAKLCMQHARSAAQEYPDYYPSHLVLDKNARVVITNILSSTLGMNLALTLQRVCKVDSIMGMDVMLPNTPTHRMSLYMKRYALLKRNGNFHKIVIPFVGIEPKVEAEFQRLVAFRPTHVIHIVSEDTTISNPLYHINQAQLEMEQWLTYMRYSSSPEVDAMRAGPPNFLYVGSNVNAMQLLHTMAISYHSLYGVASTGITIPHIYGPWGRYDSWTFDMAETVIESSINNRTSSVASPRAQEMYLYSSDAVEALVASLQFSRQTHTTLAITSSSTAESLARAFVSGSKASAPGATKKSRHWKKWIAWMPTTRSITGIQRLLAWHTNQHARSLVEVEDESTYSDIPMMPCASECSNPKQCLPSAYDSLSSRQHTKGCKFVIYMADLAVDVDELPTAATPTKNTTSVCQVAFVSNASSVVRTREYNGWMVVPVPGDESTMSEMEIMLPKIAPAQLFSQTVSKAMYIQAPFSLPASAETLLALFTRSIDAPGRKGKYKASRRPGTSIVKWTWQEPVASRLAMFTTHQESSMLVRKSSKLTATVKKEILERDGLTEGKNLSLQLSFYEHAGHLIANRERRMEYQRDPATLMLYFVRSDMLVHDMREAESSRLRCEWYQEHTFWGNHGLEELSLAYILGRRQVLRQHGVDEDIPVGQNDLLEWTPLLDAEGNRRTRDTGMELFVRIVPNIVNLRALPGTNTTLGVYDSVSSPTAANSN